MHSRPTEVAKVWLHQWTPIIRMVVPLLMLCRVRAEQLHEEEADEVIHPVIFTSFGI